MLKGMKPKYWMNGQAIIHPLATINVTTLFASSSNSWKTKKNKSVTRQKVRGPLNQWDTSCLEHYCMFKVVDLSNQTLPHTIGMILYFQYFNARLKSR